MTKRLPTKPKRKRGPSLAAKTLEAIRIYATTGCTQQAAADQAGCRRETLTKALQTAEGEAAELKAVKRRRSNRLRTKATDTLDRLLTSKNDGIALEATKYIEETEGVTEQRGGAQGVAAGANGAGVVFNLIVQPGTTSSVSPVIEGAISSQSQEESG